MKLELVLDKIKELLGLIKINGIFKNNTKGFVIGIIVATLIFIIKENKNINNVISAFKNKRKNQELMEEVKGTMEDKNISFDEATQFLINKKSIECLRTSKDVWFVNDKVAVGQGERVSFVDKEIGLVQGDFMGIINSELIGYDDLYVLRLSRDGSIRQAPISFVEEDSVYVYR